MSSNDPTHAVTRTYLDCLFVVLFAVAVVVAVADGVVPAHAARIEVGILRTGILVAATLRYSWVCEL